MTYQSGLKAGEANHRGARKHLNEHAGAEYLVEVVYYSEQTLMIADRSPEPLDEDVAAAATNLVRIVIIFFTVPFLDRRR